MAPPAALRGSPVGSTIPKRTNGAEFYAMDTLNGKSIWFGS